MAAGWLQWGVGRRGSPQMAGGGAAAEANLLPGWMEVAGWVGRGQWVGLGVGCLEVLVFEGLSLEGLQGGKTVMAASWQRHGGRVERLPVATKRRNGT